MGIQDAGALVQCDFEIFGHVQGGLTNLKISHSYAVIIKNVIK